MRAILLVPILLLFGIVTAQTDGERSYYLGTLGTTPLQMELAVSGDTLSGWYRLDGAPVPIDIDGRIDDLVYTFDERSHGVITSTFSAMLTMEPDLQEITLEGTRSSSDGRVLPFSLERVAEYSTIDLHQGRIDARRSLPFFVDRRLSAFNEPLHATALAELADFFEQGRESLLTGELYYGWTIDETTDIHYLGLGFVSVRSSIYSYTGGAHGNHNHRAFNLQLIDGEVRSISLADLFAPDSDFLAPLSRIVIEDLRRQGAYDVVEGMLTELSEDDLAVFTLSPTGITFAFAPYHVGPYAQGSFFVTVPLEIVAAYADPEGPLTRLLTGR